MTCIVTSIYFKKGQIEFPIEKNIILQDGIFLIVAEIILFACLYLEVFQFIFQPY